jgi:hypothetical protein
MSSPIVESGRIGNGDDRNANHADRSATDGNGRRSRPRYGQLQGHQAPKSEKSSCASSRGFRR